MLGLVASMLVLGLAHGLGPDHCIAVSALAAQRRHGAMAQVALRFGLAHASVLLLFATALLALDWTFSEHTERAGELANGVLLVLLGAGLVFDRIGKGLTFHTHPHSHGGQVHSHAHVHALKRPPVFAGASRGAVVAFRPAGEAPRAHAHDHARSAWAVGALFAFSGIRNAAMALPVALHGQVAGALIALGFFGLGVVLSMVGYGYLFAFGRDWAQRRGLTDRALRVGLGLVSAAFGVFWIATA
jgi:ABC-type nickel/cobalt efflux system permease component RcnA